MGELKPCPFCGGAAELHHYAADEYERWFAKCGSCGAVNGEAEAESEPDHDFAVESWNRRTHPQPVTPAASKLERALQSAYDHGVAGAPFPMVDCLRQLTVTPAGGEVYSGDAFDAWFERNGFPANTKRMRSLAFEYGWRAAKAAHPPIADDALDTARMDWADKNLADFSRGHSTVHYALSNQGKTSVGHTFREVIDQAMQDSALNQRGGGDHG